MKHLKKTLLTLTALFALSTGAGATELTVSDGTAETSYFPIAKEYIQCYQKNEMVFPAEDLTAMTGQNITAIQFYANQQSYSLDGVRYKVLMKEVNSSDSKFVDNHYSFYSDDDDATIVYEGELSVADSKLTVTFTTPYAYNGGNLVIGFYNTNPVLLPAGTALKFYGADLSTKYITVRGEAGSSQSLNDITTGAQYAILPKTTFTYSNVEMNDDMTEAKFTMPASDATVDYELVRDMEYQVAFSGLAEKVVVKQGGDNKYQPLTPLTIQLLDQLAATDAQDIIAAEGIKVNVLRGKENSTGGIDYDETNPIEYDDFLADMQPGLYKIVAEPTDATTSPYTGTASLEFQTLAGYPVDVAANEYVTYYSATDNLTVDDDDAQLYTITAVSGDAATLTEIPSANKEMPFLVYNSSDEKRTIVLVPTDVETNQAFYEGFKGTTEATTIAASTDGLNNYAFNGKKFVWVMEELPVAANKAWLAIPATPSSARTINLVFGDATAIGAVSGSPADNGDIYDLNGRKLDKKPTRKGVYIQNGRKVVIK